MRRSHSIAAVLLALLIACQLPLARGDDDAVQAFAAQLRQGAQWDADRWLRG